VIRVTSDHDAIDVDAVVHFLQNESYWATERSREDIERTMETSLCFAVLDDDRFVGFARIVTDTVTFNYLCDFFILPDYQNRGFGSAAIKLILEDDRLSRGVWILFTQTAHEFYRRIGFVQDERMFERIMVKHRPHS
jgi:GNAT superfamily N-acetyltransferase